MKSSNERRLDANDQHSKTHEVNPIYCSNVLSNTSEIKESVVEELYRRYNPRIENRCYQLLGNREDAADAAHDVFVTLITRGDMFRHDSNWLTWLYRVASNKCLNRLKYVSIRNSTWRQDFVTSHFGSAYPDNEERVATRQTLDSVLSECDKVTQKAAVYHFLVGASQQEISEVLGVSRVTVNKRLMGFKSRMRECA